MFSLYRAVTVRVVKQLIICTVIYTHFITVYNNVYLNNVYLKVVTVDQNTSANGTGCEL